MRGLASQAELVKGDSFAPHCEYIYHCCQLIDFIRILKCRNLNPSHQIRSLMRLSHDSREMEISGFWSSFSSYPVSFFGSVEICIRREMIADETFWKLSVGNKKIYIDAKCLSNCGTTFADKVSIPDHHASKIIDHSLFINRRIPLAAMQCRNKAYVNRYNGPSCELSFYRWYKLLKLLAEKNPDGTTGRKRLNMIFPDLKKMTDGVLEFPCSLMV